MVQLLCGRRCGTMFTSFWIVFYFFCGEGGKRAWQYFSSWTLWLLLKKYVLCIIATRCQMIQKQWREKLQILFSFVCSARSHTIEWNTSQRFNVILALLHGIGCGGVWTMNISYFLYILLDNDALLDATGIWPLKL